MNNLRLIIQNTFPYWCSALLLIWCIRIVEFIQFSNLFFEYSFSYFIQGLFFDLWFVLLSSTLFILVLIPFSYILKRHYIWIFHILTLFFITIQVGLSQYFVLMQIPLDSSIYFLTWNDLAAVIDLNNYIQFSTFLLVVIGLFLYFFIGNKLKKVKINDLYVFIPLFLSSLFFSFSVYESKIPSKTMSMNNHLNYFIHKSIDYFMDKNASSNTEKNIQPRDFNQLNTAFFPFSKEDENYPLLHDLNTNCAFNQQFNLDPKNPPNIVVIIVESLNSYFLSDEQQTRIEIMPFLKDLSKKSLFFPNTLSTGERTLNVLPATLASLPIPSDNISASALDPMPLQFSLPSLLKKEYYSRFYCGVNLSFTNMNGYMNYNQTDYLVDNWNPKFKKVNDEFYNDADVFEQSWLDLKRKKSKKNLLDIFLTFSTHEPFIYPAKSTYSQKVKNIIQSSKLKGSIKAHVIKNSEKFGSFMYLDDELKKYFSEAKRHPSHKNTIYFIVGDHGSELCYFDPVSRFHTSLVVYSPLLIKPMVSREVVSHLDITPSIISLLNNYPDLNLPLKVPFAGKELAINKNFRSARFLPFKANNLQLFALIYGNYFILDGQLFKVGKNLEMIAIENATVLQKMKSQLDIYTTFSRYSYLQNQIVPYSLASKYIQINKLYPFFYVSENSSESKFENKQFITIGKAPIIPKKCEIIDISIEIELEGSDLNSQDELPDFVFNFEDRSKKEKQLLFYKGVKPELKSTFKKKGTNILYYHSSVQMKDFKKSENISFDYYIYNSLGKKLKIKQYKIQIKSDVPAVKTN